MVPGLVKKKSEIRMLPQFITLVLSHDQKKMIIPEQERMPENIQKISVPNKINEKKKQIKPNPNREIKRSVQTGITSDLLKKMMTPDEEDNRLAALSDGEGNMLSPHDQGMQIVMPYYKRNPAPPYPEIARQRGYQGIVMLEVLINQEGKVDEILLFQSSGHIILDRAAIASVTNWVFEPGKKGDETVKMRVKVPIRFQLK
jgi:protein TonB